MDDDVEMQAPHGDTDDNKTRIMRACCVVSIAFVAIVVCTVVLIQYFRADTQYSVGIDSVSSRRLDPATGLSFNLTLRVASRSHGAKACVKPGTIVEVFYHGVQVAGSIPETRKICAGPRKTAEVHVVAMATGLPVGHVLESLKADMRQGAPVFDAKLNVPA